MVNQYIRKFKKLSAQQKAGRVVGIIGTLLAIGSFIHEPSFLTPDKLFVLALLVGLIFGLGKQVILRLGPFAALLLVYESFRGLVPHLNQRVNFFFMIDTDKLLGFDTLPTTTLQNLLWEGHVSWYDYAFYAPYMMHFVLPFVLAIIVWKTREHEYWRYITAYLGISFFAFLIFLLFPAAPPWMASDFHYIDPIARISSHVWFSIGLHDFPSVYNNLSPNPVAAVPSLHAAYATLFAMFVINFYRFRWRWLIIVYPLAIYIGTIYQGEHYAIDEILGAILGVAGFYASPWVLRQILNIYNFFETRSKKLVLAWYWD